MGGSLKLLRDLIRETGAPSLPEVRAAALDIFAARDAAHLGYPERRWPTRITAYPHWATSYERAANSARIPLTLEDAVAQVNLWLDELDASWPQTPTHGPQAERDPASHRSESGH